MTLDGNRFEYFGGLVLFQNCGTTQRIRSALSATRRVRKINWSPY